MMKKVLLTLLSIVLLGGMQAFADKEPIDVNTLPKAAQKCIAYNWPSTITVSAVQDGTRYEVLLSDDTQIKFDAKGRWREAECSDGLPETLVPVEIRLYVAKRYGHVLIIELSRKLDKKGKTRLYKVETSNGMDLIFDKNGKFVKINQGNI